MFGLRAVVFTVVMTAAAPAFSQSPDAVTQARAKWDSGARALRSGDLEGARAAFQEAYDTLPSPELAQSLGQVEFRLHRFAGAARHLGAALNSPKLTATERSATQKSFQQSVARVGALIVQVDVDEPDVEVDGDSVDTRLDEPWYVEPGNHVVRVHKAGYLEASQTVAIEAGGRARVALSMKPRSEPAPSERPPIPPPASQTSVPIEPKAPASTPAPLALGPQSGRSSERPQHERGSAVRTVVLVTGAALTGISIGVGTYFLVKKSRDQDHAMSLRDQATAMGGCNVGDGGRPPAGSGLCQSLTDAYPPIDTDRTFMGVSFIAAGVFGAATVGTLLLWPRSSGAPDIRAAVDPFSKSLVIAGGF